VVPLLGRAADAAERELFEAALRAAAHAYAPYSGVAVGAVAVGPSGRGHPGVNVENASYPAGLCAERAALAALIASGERELRCVAVAAAGGGDCLPCGFCLQALAEFGDPVIVAQIGGALRAVRLRELLTAPFACGDGEVAP
jgi:cytidine deaminase